MARFEGRVRRVAAVCETLVVVRVGEAGHGEVEFLSNAHLAEVRGDLEPRFERADAFAKLVSKWQMVIGTESGVSVENQRRTSDDVSSDISSENQRNGVSPWLCLPLCLAISLDAVTTKP